MIQCAGIMFLSADGTALVLQRNDGAWDFPGGHVDDGETIADAAVREAAEEIGVELDTPGEILMRSTAFGADFTTFLKRVPEAFVPKINGEHCAFAWVRPDAVMSPVVDIAAAMPAEDPLP